MLVRKRGPAAATLSEPMAMNRRGAMNNVSLLKFEARIELVEDDASCLLDSRSLRSHPALSRQRTPRYFVDLG